MGWCTTLRHASFEYPHDKCRRLQLRHLGLCSSHRTCRFLHVEHPALLLTCGRRFFFSVVETICGGISKYLSRSKSCGRKSRLKKSPCPWSRLDTSRGFRLVSQSQTRRHSPHNFPSHSWFDTFLLFDERTSSSSLRRFDASSRTLDSTSNDRQSESAVRGVSLGQRQRS